IFLSDLLLMAGMFLMLWGTLWLLKPVDIHTLLHPLGVSDTLGAFLVVSGLCFRYPRQIIPLGVAALALLIWGPLVTYVIARGCTGIPGRRDRTDH
ncbi:MAG TPA: monovalent cation/H(+) antiporter subunit G, partial [Synergistales bacterium]|nr:monovalent cation/H(+) antiporter subunit G [Synergistales bacterium]